MIRQDYAPKMFPRPWYVAPFCFLGGVITFYALIWLATAFVEKADCWSSVDSTGCAVVWAP